MKKNYLLCMLLSMITLGAWAEDTNTSFEKAIAVTAGTPTAITYGVIENDTVWKNPNDHEEGYEVINYGTAVQHWYKYTATTEGGEYVFIEDAAKLKIVSKGTIAATWVEKDATAGTDLTDNPLTGTTLYFKLEKGQAVTFYLSAPGNFSTINNNTGAVIKANPVASTFEVITYACTQYPSLGTMEEDPIVLEKGVSTYVMPSPGDSYNFIKMTPDQDGRLTFRADKGRISGSIRVIEGDSWQNISEDDVYDNNYSLFSFIVKAGHEYIVRSYRSNKRFQVSYSLTAINPGEDCRLPVEISAAGEYDIKAGEAYYQYTAQQDTYLVLRSSLNNAYAEILSDCNSDADKTSVSTADGGFYLKRAVKADETVIIRVVGQQNPGKFNLSLAAAQPGWDKEHAIEITNMTQTTFALNPYADEYWFKFTSPADADTKVYTIKAAEQNRFTYVGVQAYRGVGTPFTPIVARDSVDMRLDNSSVYYVKWEIRASQFTDKNLGDKKLDQTNPGNFTFGIISMDVPVGRYESHPIQIAWNDITETKTFFIGSQVGEAGKPIPNEQFPGEVPLASFFYYSFVAEADGFVTFATNSDEWSSLWTVGWKEDGKTKIGTRGESGSYQMFIIGVEAGKTYTWCPVPFVTENPVEFRMKYEAPKPGQACSNPITLGTEQIDIANPLSNEGVWYVFTATTEGAYKVTAWAGTGGSVRYKIGGCDAVEDPGTGNGENPRTAEMYLLAGQKALIKYTYYQTWGNVQNAYIKIEPTTRPTGVFAQNPIVVAHNVVIDIVRDTENYSNGAWYSYTAQGTSLDIKMIIDGMEYYAKKDLKIYDASDYHNVVNVKGTNYSIGEAETDGSVNSVTHTFNAAVVGNKYLFNFSGYPKDQSKFVINETPVGIDNNKAAESISIYPNPNDGNFIVALGELAAESNAVVEVADLSGKVIYRDVVAGETASVNLPNVAAGTYLVKVSTDSACVVKKAIIR